MKSIWAAWPDLKKHLLSKKRKFFLLDFDGTLAPIAKTPHEVAFDTRTKAVLFHLSLSPSHRIAIISGRSLKDLQSYFNLRDVFYAGNHGLEIQAKRLSLPSQVRQVRKYRPLIRDTAKRLRIAFLGLPGVWVEDKNDTLSVHFRNLPQQLFALFRRKLVFFQKAHKHLPLVWRKGKRTCEVRPDISWGKGEVATFFLKRFPASLPIVIGDDVTDEDMFHAFKHKGITIRVGYSRNSAARYYLKSPADVVKFLERLCR